MPGPRDRHDIKDIQIPDQSSSLCPSPRATAPRKRSRRWEREQQSRKVVYRGIDPKLAWKVRTIADDLLLPAGEVACAVIEYALRSYERGDFDLHPRPDPDRTRMTLVPPEGPMHSMDGPRHTSRQKRANGLWRVITTWRGFSPELKKELAALASGDGLNVPIGELITALLRFGLRAHAAGWLRLEPKAKSRALARAKTGKP